jgi:hypothetical protein
MGCVGKSFTSRSQPRHFPKANPQNASMMHRHRYLLVSNERPPVRIHTAKSSEQALR